MTALAPAHNDLREIRWIAAQSRAPRLRTMREFAEQEIVLPKGPFAGRRFNCERQPYSRLYFDAVDSGQWNRIFATGPTQSGKTLTCSIVPLMYHLFELQESVIFGVPDMDLAGDKWREDILPAIQTSRYRDLLPKRGGGSRGGKVESLQFSNGAVLKFMSGGGGDKSRASYTARALVVTEVDGLDEVGGTSREASKLKQLEARTRAYGSRKRVYGECTVSIEQGATWTEYTEGTRSRILLDCPRCRQWVAPEREHLVGWDNADNEVEAAQQAAFACPACGELWSEEDRRAAHEGAVLLHRGQELDDSGDVTGDLPQTNTLGFRWSAVNNLFVEAGDVGADEWIASRSSDEENAEKEMRQFVWALPYENPAVDIVPLDAHTVQRRTDQFFAKQVPPDVQHLTIGIDVGKYIFHYLVIAWRDNNRALIVDYGIVDIHSEQNPTDKATLMALRGFRDEYCLAGWPVADAQQSRIPDQVWIDSGYPESQLAVYAFCRESGDRFRPVKGWGMSEFNRRQYRDPEKINDKVRHIGESYHLAWQPERRIGLVHIDADYWKTKFHQALSCEAGGPGSISLFKAQPREHLKLSKHFTSERQVEDFDPKKGVIHRWEKVSRQNHWFDAAYMATAAGHACGVRLIAEKPTDRGEPDPKNGQRRGKRSKPSRFLDRPGGWIKGVK